MSEPVRTCVACRKSCAQRELVRLVWDPSLHQVVTDLVRRLPGRGAYLHDTPACWRNAIRKPRVGRALRLTGQRAAGATAERLAELAGARDVGIELSGTPGRDDQTAPVNGCDTGNQKVGNRS